MCVTMEKFSYKHFENEERKCLIRVNNYQTNSFNNDSRDADAAPYATELQRKKFKGPVHYKRDADAEALKAWQRKKIAENRY
ncbi:hypothetical protein RIR_jg32109.t1 [Rhizophagus irregularis DAOM 181602=DAOM 197198]|uniref:Uncharacterized protein n=1 Tax=Rhizophagus irregularis (strain DAOM 181602 / DAOM 197198 / MUCL 43194) TaxID=747089 RepID=U9UEQ2_RHIID|nr:hypothetical protein RIR_jg32109.t1 [Rhizophagus irregularis DAOM 181602=DAOM 197198]